MKQCPGCKQDNRDESRFCYQCGTNLPIDGQPAPAPSGEFNQPGVDLWNEFLGPNADRYLAHFKKFGSERVPKFALTWNWPAFLFVSFLWFLYRKMYLYALVYAIGPMISAYLTGDITVGIVWSIMAGATANYVYYWYCREHIEEIRRKTGTDPHTRRLALQEAGGVQPYVIWVGVAFYVLVLMMMVKIAQEGVLDERLPTKPSKPAVSTET